ncbi:zinc finger protein CONSTANS-LIKE 5 isoform X2 [Cicer arietinum]|uniref:Zinc finger protein CONSTANS-LIKE 5 isoform X2 n=1 Tax=Cicer arietinum TaxID=3827 RepID=A0A1S2YP86_CICAR|nr:zinc finger protein CONSTANS-LIKE 5 isoform X2 [Cicer arietinum]
MGIERGGGGGLKGFRSGWSVPPKLCDSCKLSSAALFCRSHSAFLCINCDSRIHCANKLSSRHERVWMCEVCEQAPASVTCKADAAALCVTCDSDIHSANPLARRHERVPVEPFFDSAESVVNSSTAATAGAFNFAVPTDDCFSQDDAEAAAWLIPNPNFTSKLTEAPDIKTRDMFFSDMDPFIDFDYSNTFQNNNNCSSAINDSVVPVQTKPTPAPMMNHNSESCFDIDFCRSKLSSFNYPAQSISQSVSSSSLDVGVVPDGNAVPEMSYSFGRNSSESSGMVSGGVNSQQGVQVATQLCGMDREARVLRYREKRKNRKFEKTIRYASRKAYAETRPRIKGRFAKRTEIDSEVDRLYDPIEIDHLTVPSSLLIDSPYGVVPTF